MFKNLIDITDTQIELAQKAMVIIHEAKDSGEIDERMANALLATQIVKMQLYILESQILKEVKKNEQN